MSYRKTKEATQAKKQWERFVSDNLVLISKTGLPEIILYTEQHWTDFLMHGYLDHHDDPTQFKVDEMSKKEYESLKELVRRYFEAGHSYFTPMALSIEHQQEMRGRFDKTSERK